VPNEGMPETWQSAERLALRRRRPGIIKTPAPKGRANNARANGLGFGRDPILLWSKPCKGAITRRQPSTPAERRLRLERLVTPLKG